jgi:ABC-type transport system involved in multi-copper enzyme maturation permease subunit
MGWLEAGPFLAGSTLVSILLTVTAVAKLRPAATRRLDRPGRRQSAPAHRLWPGPSLDGNPVRWREWHRRHPTGWIGWIWLLYALIALGATATMIILVVSRGLGVSTAVASFLSGVQVAAGLLLLVVTSTTSLAEERARGELDLLLTTPLATRSIVLGKWWGAFRTVPRIAILPAISGFAVACRSGRFEGTALLAGLVVSYGAVLASLGLALATWVPHAGRAATLGVVIHVLLTVGWFFLVMALTQGASGFLGPGLASASPFIGISFTTIAMQVNGPKDWWECRAWMSFWIVVELAVAGILLAVTLATFDRCLGRITAGPRDPAAIPGGPPGDT